MARCSALYVMLALLATACGGDDPVGPSEPVIQPALLMTTSAVAGRLNDAGLVMLHVGTQTGYRAGHIPGARFVDYASVAITRDNMPFEIPDVPALETVFESAGVSDGNQVVLYTETGMVQAARAFFTLDYLGHGRVALLDGGLDAWKAENRTLSTESVTPVRGSFTPRPRADRLVTADWIAQRLQSPDIVLIDSRVAAEYSGESPGSWNPPRPGHIPGAATSSGATSWSASRTRG